MIILTWWQLAISATLLLALALILWLRNLGLAGTLLLSACRMTVQLWLLGLILDQVFALESLWPIIGIALIMIAMAGREIGARQKRALAGWWRWLSGTSAAASSSLLISLLLLLCVIQPAPWWDPHYAIPLLGMLLGNTITGIALASDRLTTGAWDHQSAIEAQLCSGASGRQALDGIRREAWRAGLMPTINGMAMAGIVSLPGMMTGQILAGVSPGIAVRYQIMIFLAIGAGTGFGTLLAVEISSKRLIDQRHRLRLRPIASGRSKNSNQLV